MAVWATVDGHRPAGALVPLWRVLAALLVVVAACSSADAPTTPTPNDGVSGGTRIRILMLTATAGFRHDSIATARQAMANLASATGEFTITATARRPSVCTMCCSSRRRAVNWT